MLPPALLLLQVYNQSGYPDFISKLEAHGQHFGKTTHWLSYHNSPRCAACRLLLVLVLCVLMVAGGGQGQRRAVCGAGCPLRMCRSGGGLRSNVGPDFECMPPAPAPTPPCRRAKIFRRDQGGVRDLAGMKALMRGNNWRKDPVGALGVCLCVGVGGGMGGRGLYPLSPRRGAVGLRVGG